MSLSSYQDFVARKLTRALPAGISNPPALHASMFPHQVDLTRWALRRGRAAIFAATGLGKTAMELEWARVIRDQTRSSVLILCPLAVAEQTVKEGRRLGLEVLHARDGADVSGKSIVVTNYDRLHRFDSDAFGAVVLDESSIIKHHDAKTFDRLRESFGNHPFRLCATATPSPNDYMELGTHAEFLGICTRSEMLSEYFVHDGGETQKWRLKKHARDVFWRFVASWGAMVRLPSDLGHDDAGYLLPDLNVAFHSVGAEESEALSAGLLFAMPAQTMSERRAARKASVNHRATECAARVNADRESWIVWCDLNYEADALARLIPGAVEIRGSDTIDDKESRLAAFSSGRVRVLITKPSIAGWGLNWQHCARVAFVGVSDSWEQYHQAIRRCWRFGQTRPVEVHAFASELEGEVLANLRRKEADAEAMSLALAAETAKVVRSEVIGASGPNRTAYARTADSEFPDWIRSEMS
jgi:hypothetical protein